MLLAEELALIALNPRTGRHRVGMRGPLNACLAGLLIGELVLDEVAEPVPGRRAAVTLTGRSASSTTLAAAAAVVAETGPSVRAALSHMSRALDERLGCGTWGTAVAGLVSAGMLASSGSVGGIAAARIGGRGPRLVVDVAARGAIVDRLRLAASGDGPIEARTAMLLSMTGPAKLLEVVAPERAGRGHARRRIDHAGAGTRFECVAQAVRKLIADGEAAAVIGSPLGR